MAQQEYSVAQLAKLSQLTERTLRYYDQIGLLVPRRDSNGYRVYDEADVLMLERIVILRSCGMSLSDISTALSDEHVDLSVLLKGHLESLHAQQAELARAIAATVSYTHLDVYKRQLYLLGLSDRAPGNLSVSVPRGYNPQELRRTYPDMRIHRESEGLYGLGKMTVRDPMGVTVPVYDAERSIADIIRERAKGTVNPQLVRDAMVGYFRKDDRDLPRLCLLYTSRCV